MITKTKQDKQLIETIINRTNWKENVIPDQYIGFDMSKTHSQSNINITLHNIKVLDLFNDYLDVFYILQHFDCWKGVCFWTIDPTNNFDKYACEVEKEFGGWSSKDIILWLIKNKGKYKKEIKEENGENKQRRC